MKKHQNRNIFIVSVLVIMLSISGLGFLLAQAENAASNILQTVAEDSVSIQSASKPEPVRIQTFTEPYTLPEGGISAEMAVAIAFDAVKKPYSIAWFSDAFATLSVDWTYYGGHRYKWDVWGVAGDKQSFASVCIDVLTGKVLRADITTCEERGVSESGIVADITKQLTDMNYDRIYGDQKELYLNDIDEIDSDNYVPPKYKPGDDEGKADDMLSTAKLRENSPLLQQAIDWVNSKGVAGSANAVSAAVMLDNSIGAQSPGVSTFKIHPDGTMSEQFFSPFTSIVEVRLDNGKFVKLHMVNDTGKVYSYSSLERCVIDDFYGVKPE